MRPLNLPVIILRCQANRMIGQSIISLSGSLYFSLSLLFTCVSISLPPSLSPSLFLILHLFLPSSFHIRDLPTPNFFPSVTFCYMHQFQKTGKKYPNFRITSRAPSLHRGSSESRLIYILFSDTFPLWLIIGHQHSSLCCTVGLCCLPIFMYI